MGPRGWLAVLLIASPFGAIAAQSSVPLTLARRSSPSATVQPGDGLTLVYQVTSGARYAHALTERVDMPDGWQRVASPGSFTLTGRDSVLRMVRVLVPADAAPGDHQVHYALTDGARVILRDSVRVSVPARHRIGMEVREPPRLALAGRAYAITVRVVNLGNASSPVALLPRSSAGFKIAPRSARLDLAAGESRTVEFRVQTTIDDAVARRGPAFDHFSLRARAGHDSTATTEVMASVEVIPPAGEPGSRFHHYPAQLTIRATPDGSISTEVSASGPLTPGGRARLDLYALPSPNGLNGELDVYRATLTAPNYELRAGDHTFSLSHLTSGWRAGSGVGGNVTLGAVEFGGYAERNRRVAEGRGHASQAAYLDVELFPALRIGATHLAREDSTSIWSARASLAPLRGVELRTEYARDAVGGDPGTAIDISLTGTHQRLSYDLRHLDADSNYRGAVRAVTSDQGRAALRLARWLRLTARGGRNIGAAVGPWGVGGTRRSTLAAAGVIAGPLSAEVRRQVDEVMIASTYRHDAEESVRLVAAPRIGSVSVFASGEVGALRRDMAAMTAPFGTYAASATFGVLRRATVSAGAEYHAGADRAVRGPQQRLSLHASAQLDIPTGTMLSFSWSATQETQPELRRRNVVYATLVQDLPAGHRVMARGRLISSGRPSGLVRQSTFDFAYSIPVGLPVGPSHNSARLVGRVYDAASGKPLPNAVVRVGDRAVMTDRNGRASFSGLAPDAYHVVIDGASIGEGRVTTGENPLTVDVRAMRTSRFEVGIVAGAWLAGTVRRHTQAPQLESVGRDSLVYAGPMQGAHVIAVRGRDTLHAVSDMRGRFEFGRIAPGEWTLSLPGDGIPAHHEPIQSSVAVRLGAGDSTHVMFDVREIRRVVRMVASGELVLDGVPTSAAPGRATLRLPTGTDGARTYTVTQWDLGLPQLAWIMYGDASLWPKIWEANASRINDQAALAVGTRLIIPDSAALTISEIRRRDAYMAPRSGAERARRRWYTATRWDRGLYHIAAIMYGDPAMWPRIWLANRVQVPNPDHLLPGTKLLLPMSGPLTSAERRARDRWLGIR